MSVPPATYIHEIYVDIYIYGVHSGARTQALSDGGDRESTRSWFVGIAAFFSVGVHSAESAIPIEQSISRFEPLDACLIQ